MSTDKEVEEFERVLIIDNSGTDSKGRTIYKLMPGCRVKINGEDFIETLHDDASEDGLYGKTNRFVGIEFMEEGSPKTYNPSDEDPVFEFHTGI
jgi:hypothetical protein